MAKLVVLNYKIVLDPTETWSALVDFEVALIKFFSENNMEAVISENQSNPADRFIFVNKKPIIPIIPTVQPGTKPKSVGAQIRDAKFVANRFRAK